jgi:hypothetical protein
MVCLNKNLLYFQRIFLIKNRDGDAREIAIIKYAEYAELDIAAIRQLYPRRDVHHFTPENKRIVCI